MCAVFRPIKNEVPEFSTLNLPETLIDFSNKKN